MTESNSLISPLYAPYYTAKEKRALAALPPNDLTEEINLVRYLNVLLLKFQQTGPKDFHARLLALNTCVVLNRALCSLIRVQLKLHPPGEEAYKLIEEAFDALPDHYEYPPGGDMALEDPLHPMRNHAPESDPPLCGSPQNDPSQPGLPQIDPPLTDPLQCDPLPGGSPLCGTPAKPPAGPKPATPAAPASFPIP